MLFSTVSFPLVAEKDQKVMQKANLWTSDLDVVPHGKVVQKKVQGPMREQEPSIPAHIWIMILKEAKTGFQKIMICEKTTYVKMLCCSSVSYPIILSLINTGSFMHLYRLALSTVQSTSYTSSCNLYNKPVKLLLLHPFFSAQETVICSCTGFSGGVSGMRQAVDLLNFLCIMFSFDP